MEGEDYEYISEDKVQETGSKQLNINNIDVQTHGGIVYMPEFLHTLNPSDLPPHKLKLKINTIIMLLRNLNTKDGLCNGTRLRVINLQPNVIRAKILTGK